MISKYILGFIITYFIVLAIFIFNNKYHDIESTGAIKSDIESVEKLERKNENNIESMKSSLDFIKSFLLNKKDEK